MPPRTVTLPDQAARDLIEQALDRNLLVEAGAGSGKTESLARRMAAGIAAGTYVVEGMAAVTFTRKAAAELRGRFQLELERRVAPEADPDPARRARCATALARLERLFAGTIHAFCAHLLRERPVEAGVAPGFTELDDLADQVGRRLAWRQYVERERALGSARFGALVEAGLQPKDLDDAFATVCLFPEVTFPPGGAPVPDPVPARRALERFWTRLERLLPRPLPRGTTCEVQRRARELRGRLRVADLERPAELAAILARWERRPRLVRKWWPNAAPVQALVAGFSDEIAPWVAAWRRSCYRVAVAFLEGGRADAAEARRRAVALNYEDLLQLAARLLRERADVRAALQAKYRWLFVDEFQDTDPVQAEVIGLLAAAPAPGRGPADWTRVALRPGALFVVGDPKQSIYRFRRADIETYARVRARIEATGGQTVGLTTSFRARPVLCEWANAVFPRFFPRRATPQQPAFDRLDPVREAGDRRATGVRQLVVPADVPKAEVIERDAEAIARFVRAEVDGARRRWGDFLVLTCRKKVLADYAAAFEALDVPVEVSGAAGFRESPAVRVLATLLGALSDPADEPALVGVLRGPLLGLSDVELFRYVRAGRRLRLTTPVPADAGGPVAGALRQLYELYRETRRLPAPAAVERVLEATGWLAAGVGTSPAGAEAGHLLHAVDRVRRITEAGGTLAEAARALEDALESSEVESVPLESGRRDVVRLMNLHKAKGLEADVVFLADPLNALPERVSVRIIREDGGPRGYFQISRSGGWQGEVLAEPADWATHETAELAYIQAEGRRLLYVAGTRARDLLVVSRWAGARSAGPWDAFAPYLKEAPALRVPDVEPPAASRTRVTLEARAAAAASREERLAAARQASWQVDSVTATAHHAAPVGRPVQAGRVREPDTGLAWGTLVHALLEEAGRAGHRDRAHLERVARWLTMEDPELRRVVPEALDTVEQVLASNLWQQARAAEELDVEIPFASRTATGILYGVIDLAFRTDAGWSLIDYKTDQLDLATLTVRYADQVRQYATHWSALTGDPISYAGLYAVREGQLSRHVGT